MRLPKMKYRDGIRKGQQIAFGGLNKQHGASDGELADMENLTGDHYPLLAVRPRRWKCRKLESPGGMYCWEKLCWVDGTAFYFDGIKRGTVAAGEKTIASLGNRIVIFPDKCYYDVETEGFGQMEAVWQGAELTFSDGTYMEEPAAANTVTCSGVNWQDYFRAGDAVTITGCSLIPGNNLSIVIRQIDGDKLVFYENSFTLQAEGTAYTETGELKISRTVPDMLYLCENKNRLWGCSGSTIYASMQGDIFNWNVYDGLESDSWTWDPGSPGRFTGCVSYGGYPIFFKEEHIYKVYGDLPSEFSALGAASLGLAQGSHKSLAVAGEVLFYLSRSGVMAYTGGIPQPMGGVFGTQRYKNAVGGSDGLKYYISMESSEGMWSLFVYDTQTGLWHREDSSRVVAFARCNGDLYMLLQDGSILLTGQAQAVPEGAEREPEVQWFAQFADFTDQDPNRKGVSKLQLRMELGAGAYMVVKMMFDCDGQWREIARVEGREKKESFYLPICPRRADHYRLRLEGSGECRIYSLVRESYSGSEM